MKGELQRGKRMKGRPEEKNSRGNEVKREKVSG